MSSKVIRQLADQKFLRLFFLLPIFIFLLLLLISTNANKVFAQERPSLTPELVSCLKEKMGEEVFDAIKSGSRQPTAEEVKKGEACFAKSGLDFRRPGEKPEEAKREKPKFSPEATACIKKALGDDFENQLMAVKSKEEGDALMEKAKGCFGPPQGAQKVPDSVKQCMIRTIGEAETNKIFQGGKPDENSEVFKRLEGAGCFKDFKHEGAGKKMEDVPPEKRSCIEGILGNLTTEPTEEQKKLIGEKCFGDKQPGEGGRERLPEAVEACLRGAVGESFKEKSPDSMSMEEKNKAGECFRQHNFQPKGSEGMNQPRPQLSEDVRACIEKITGQPMSGKPELDDAAKNRVNQECFGGKADQMTGEGGPAGMSREELDACTKKIVGENNPGPYSQELRDKIAKECSEKPVAGQDNPRAAPEKQACVAQVQSSTTEKLTYEEMQKKINETCFKEQRYGEAPRDDTQQGPRPGATEGERPPGSSGEVRSGPGGCTTKECAQEYCAKNPTQCTEDRKQE